MELINELEKIKNKKYSQAKEEYSLVSEAKQLLLEHANKHQEIIDKLGINNNNLDKKLKHDYIRSVNSEQIYNKPSFNGSEIKDLCDIYDLRCLQIKSYKGTYPLEMLNKIDEFSKENNINIDVSNFFIIAPSETFNLKKHIKPKPVDPIILYRTNKSYKSKVDIDDNFVQIYNWGNDFLDIRKVRFMFNEYIEDRDENSNLGRTILAFFLMLIGFILTSYKDNNLLVYISSIYFLYVMFANKQNSRKNSLWNRDIF